MADVPVPRFRDFNPATDEALVSFQIGPDLFTGVSDLDIDGLASLAELATSGTNASNWREQFTAVAQLTLEPVSAARFVLRLQPLEVRTQHAAATGEAVAPGIGVRTLMELLPWLMEQYGLVPTPPSSASSAGSVDAGTGSTGGPPPTA